VLERELSDPSASSRYRGTVFFVLGAQSEDPDRARQLAAFRNEPDNDARRGVIWGLASWGSGERAKPYSVAGYYMRARYQPLAWFDIRLELSELALPLVPALLDLAEDPGQDTLSREAAVLVLGQGIDNEAGILETCMAHLRTRPWYSDELIRAWLFVAAHSSKPEVHERLLELARALILDPEDDGQGFALLCELVLRHPLPQVLELVLDSIKSGAGSYLDRSRLIVSLALVSKDSVIEASVSGAIASTLRDIAIEEPDRHMRVYATLALVNFDRPQALALLDTALASDPDPNMRSSVARIVAESFDPPRALELLEAAFARETDADVRIRIVHAIGRVPLAAATLALEHMLPHAEGELLDAIQAALERSRGR
jgi:HEAT repeat protein